jgi:hypothetical protein
LTHLQSEALIAARESTNPNDFALAVLFRVEGPPWDAH